jgi:hypothetical protein
MEIEYLQKLKDNPERITYDKKIKLEIEGISVEEIENLERFYNGGDQFPKALRELLFLAGNYSYFFDYGVNDTQKEMQEEVRETLKITERVISRPFYVLGVIDSQFLFVYLDEKEDPQIYSADPWNSSWVWTRNIPNRTIKSYVEFYIDNMKII